MRENLLEGKVSHATDCAPDVLRHDTQWQTADPRGSPATLYLTLPQKHPPSRGSPLIPSPYSVSATILAAHRAAWSVGVAIIRVGSSHKMERSWILRVALFIPCYVDQINPEVGVSVVRVLRRLGVEVIYPEGQTCCGQPAFNSGFFDEARTMGRRFLDVFERERSDYVVCPSGSCTTMVSHYYPFLFKELPEERERSEALGHRVREFSDFLVNVLGVRDVGARYEGKAVFHTGCHQRRGPGPLEDPPVRALNVQ